MDRAILTVLLILTALYSADNQVIAPLLPAIRDTLGTPVALAGYWGGAYNFAAALSALTMGPWSDRRGRKPFLWGGALLFGLAGLACAAAWNFASMLVFRFLIGFAGGMISVTAQALVGDYFPAERRGGAMGVVMSGRFLGLSLGVVVGILFAQFLGWRASFWYLAGFAGLCTVAALGLLPAVTPEQARFRNPVRLYGALVADRQCLATVLVSLMNSAALGGFLFFIGIWLREAFGFALWQIAAVFVLTGILSFGGSLISGRYADRYGRTRLVLLGNIGCAAAYLAIPLTGGHLWTASLLFGVLSLAVALWMAPLQTLVTDLVPTSTRGSMVALKNAAALLGIAVTQSASGYLYAFGGYLAVGILSAVLVVTGAVLLVRFVREPVPHTS